MTIKELRKKNHITQLEASKIVGVPLRTYVIYENDESKVGSIKYNYILEKLAEYGFIDETHGVLSLEDIKEVVKNVLIEYPVDYAILFGSYARDSALPTSDVDLLISTNITGIEFFGIVEKLRTMLKKKVELLDLRQLYDNQELIKDILREGIRIYVKDK